MSKTQSWDVFLPWFNEKPQTSLTVALIICHITIFLCCVCDPELVMLGVGYHHAGVDLSDRKLIEEAFTVGDLPVLCEKTLLMHYITPSTVNACVQHDPAVTDVFLILFRDKQERRALQVTSTCTVFQPLQNLGSSFVFTGSDIM